MDREFYSLPEAAARLGISRIAVFKRVKKGQLPALRFGRNWAVPAAALEAAATAPASPVKPSRPAKPVPPTTPRAPKEAVDALPSASEDELDSSLL